MPVNPLPILIPLILVWGAIAFFLFRWRLWAGGAFVALSVAALIVHIINNQIIGVNTVERLGFAVKSRVVPCSCTF